MGARGTIGNKGNRLGPVKGNAAQIKGKLATAAAQLRRGPHREVRQSPMESRLDALIKRNDKDGTSTGANALRDMKAGVGFGEAVLGPEGLGRMGEQQEMKDILARYKSRSEEGLSGAEFVAERERQLEGVSQAEATSMRGLQARLARSGVRGGMAGQQMAGLLGDTFRQRAGIERDLMLKSAEMKRGAFDKYAQAQSNVSGFDLQQQAKEKSMVLGAATGLAEIGQAERSSIYQANKAGGMGIDPGGSRDNLLKKGFNLAKEGLSLGNKLNPHYQATKTVLKPVKKFFCHEGNTEVLMNDGSYKKIGDIVLGDVVKEGGRVTLASKMYSEYDMYEYKGEICTGTHPILENDTWIHAKDSKLAIRREDMDNSIICPIETDNGVYITKAGYISGTLDFEYSELVENGGNNKYVENTKVCAS